MDRLFNLVSKNGENRQISQLPKPSKKGFNRQFFLIPSDKTNIFFYCFLLFLLMGGLGLTLNNQGDLLLFFSKHRSPFGDFFFRNALLKLERNGLILASFFYIYLSVSGYPY